MPGTACSRPGTAPGNSAPIAARVLVTLPGNRMTARCRPGPAGRPRRPNWRSTSRPVTRTGSTRGIVRRSRRNCNHAAACATSASPTAADEETPGSRRSCIVMHLHGQLRRSRRHQRARPFRPPARSGQRAQHPMVVGPGQSPCRGLAAPCDRAVRRDHRYLRRWLRRSAGPEGPAWPPRRSRCGQTPPDRPPACGGGCLAAKPCC